MDQREFGDWTIIFQMNCSIYMALAGEIDQAEENLRTLEKVSLELCDDCISMTYGVPKRSRKKVAKGKSFSKIRG